MKFFDAIRQAIPQRHPLRLLWHRLRGWCASARRGFPARRLRVIAVTGTDGKTTTVDMVAHILRQAGSRVGAISTAFFDVDGQRQWNATQKTSVEPEEFQDFLNRCSVAGCEFVVVEASSHGIVQGRLGPLRPEVAAITNTSLEHLDYHGSMDRYRADKGILFHMLSGRPTFALRASVGKGVKVLNADDETYERYRRIPSERTIVYFAREPEPGTWNMEHGTHLWLSDINVSPRSTSATLHTNLEPGTPAPSAAEGWNLELPIPGAFNLDNALCAIGCCLGVGVDVGTCVQALATFSAVPGRLERIDEGQPFAVFVDYTVTPVAHERVLRTLRAMVPEHRILALTGSCGDRMREKRPVVGRIASELADLVVITTDETYVEDPLAVMEEVWTGVREEGGRAHKISDRREAIRFIIHQAQPGDAVILCGMGCCTTRMTREGQIPWDERAIAREVLRSLRNP